MLVIMENRNVAFLLQLSFDLKATGCRNILQVHSCKTSGNHVNCIHDLIHILALDAQWKRIYVSKSLKEHTFSFHNRHSSLRANISQSQNRRSVCNYQTEIVAAGQFITLVYIFLNFQTWLRHSRCISQGQILLGGNRNS